MHRLRLLPLLALLALAACLAPRAAVAAGWLASEVACSTGDSTVFRWTFHDDPASPARADFVGFDVVRRTVADCGTPERVNAATFLRTPGATETFVFAEPLPAAGALFEYHALPVDAARAFVPLTPAECDGCGTPGYLSCPVASAPVTQGTLVDLGWALMVSPCPGSCYGSVYVSRPAADALRSYAGTGTVLRLYGTTACGSLEGCALALDHFDVAPCGAIVPAVPTTWGRVKTRYR